MVGRGRSKRRSRTGLARVGGDVRLSVGWLRLRRCRQVGSGIARSRARARLNWVSQGQRWGRCRVRQRGRAGEPSRQSEEPPPEGLGGHDLLAQTDSRRPAGQVVGHHLYRQPSAVGGEAARGEMVQPGAVLQVSDRILDLGVAAMISLQLEGLPVPVGAEAVIAVGGEEGQLGPGRGLHSPDDEPRRRGAGLSSGREVSGSLRPHRQRRPSSKGIGVQSASGIASMRLCRL